MSDAFSEELRKNIKFADTLLLFRKIMNVV